MWFSKLSSWPYFSENMYEMAFFLELMEVTKVIKHAGLIHKFLLKFLSIPNAFIMYSISFITPLGNKLNAIFVLHCVWCLDSFILLCSSMEHEWILTNVSTVVLQFWYLFCFHEFFQEIKKHQRGTRIKCLITILLILCTAQQNNYLQDRLSKRSTSLLTI